MKKFRDIKVGDSIFLVDRDEMDICEGTVSYINPLSLSGHVTFSSEDLDILCCHSFSGMSRVGKSLFTTWEEAESMLREWLVKEEVKERKMIDFLVTRSDHLLSFSELPFLEEESRGRKFGEIKTGDIIWESNRTFLIVREVKVTKVMYEVSNRKAFDVGFTKFSAFNGSYSSMGKTFHTTKERAHNQLVKWCGREFLRIGDKIKDRISRYDRIIESSYYPAGGKSEGG